MAGVDEDHGGTLVERTPQRGELLIAEISAFVTAQQYDAVGVEIPGWAAAGIIVGRDLVKEIRSGDSLTDSSVLPRWEDDFDPFTTTRALHAT